MNVSPLGVACANFAARSIAFGEAITYEMSKTRVRFSSEKIRASPARNKLIVARI